MADYLHWDTQGPCPDGFHIPTSTERSNITRRLSGGYNLLAKLKMPTRGYISNTGYGLQNTSNAYYWSSTGGWGSYGQSAYYLYTESSTSSSVAGISKASGLFVRPFKNSYVAPDNTWTDMGSNIYRSQTLGLISITGLNITIADKNLGATIVYNNGDTLTADNCGKYYQWGNNYGFPWSGSGMSVSSTRVNASSYGPGNYYNSSTFIYGTTSSSTSGWDTSNNENLRGGVTDERPLPPYEGNELCFTANTAGSTVKLRKVGSPTAVNIEYSTDGYAWTDYTFGDTITLSGVGDKIYFRNKSETETRFSTTSTDYYPFTMTGSISASGDVNYLLCKNSTDTVSNGCFYRLFVDCLSLTTPPILPATTLATGCYNEMFIHSGIISVPVLPATVVAVDCYYNMFKNCVSLEELPALPAVELKTNCYYGMFYGCSNIKLSTTKTGEYVKEYRIPNEGTGITASGALTAMFSQTGGTFKSTPNINTTYYTSNKVVPEPGPTPPTPTTLNKYITKLYHLGKEYIFDERVSTTGINVSPTSINLTKLNQTAQITASVIPTNADDKKIIYTSSAPSIVSVSSTGLVKALGEGNATITVKSNDGGFSKSVSVVSSFGTDINKLTYVGTKSGAYYGTTIRTSPSGDNIYLGSLPSNSQSHVRQYTLSTPGEISTMSSSYTSLRTSLGDVRPVYGVYITEGRAYFSEYNYVSSSNIYTRIIQYSITGRNISGGTVVTTKTINNTGLIDITFNPTGDKLYAIGDSNNSIRMYTLTTPRDISTLSTSATSSVLSSIAAKSFHINSTGNQMIVCTGSGKLQQYKLTTPRDLTTYSLEKEVTLSGGNQGTYITINEAGDRLFIMKSATSFTYIDEFKMS